MTDDVYLDDSDDNDVSEDGGDDNDVSEDGGDDNCRELDCTMPYWKNEKMANIFSITALIIF